MFKPTSGVGRQRGAQSGGGGRNRRVKDKIRGERARERRESREMDRRIKKEGKRSPKQWSLAGRTQIPRKTLMQTHTLLLCRPGTSSR